MCGIAGFTTIDGSAPAERIHQLLQSIHHRGPDQQGSHRSPLATLGAVRLSIIDVAGGDQPVHSEDGDSVIVFNGEVYNHAPLRKELEALGHRFHTRCDTEVVLRAFLEWDTRSFERLRGMFAFAIWTESRRRLVLVRDRMGIKPLYFARRGRDILFGSELKTLLLHPELDRRLDPAGLGYFLSLNYIPQAHTMVAGIEKLRPGCWMEWDNGRLRTEPYWQLRFAPDRAMRLDDAEAELDSLLRDSVREHLISDVPLGIWASGGLDSSTILHYAAAQTPNLETFSVSFLGRKFDESPYFREVARQYGTRHHEFDLHPGADLAAAIEGIVEAADEPSADAGALPVWFLSQMTRRHVTVALSGEGADELFGGYYTYLADRYAAWMRLAPAALRRGALAAMRLWPASDEKIGLDYKLRRFLEGSLLPPGRAHLYWNGTFSDPLRRAVSPLAADPRWETLQPATTAGCNGYLELDQLCYLPDDILNKCDRMSMAHSLEVRPPFLDHRIVEFAARLPEDFKIRGSQLKFLLRRLMGDKLPQSVLRRRKEGFDIPAHHWFRTVLEPLLRDTVNARTVRETGVFHWPALERLMGDHAARRANYGYHLWGILILMLWMRRWKITAGGAKHSQEVSPWAGVPN